MTNPFNNSMTPEEFNEFLKTGLIQHFKTVANMMEQIPTEQTPVSFGTTSDNPAPAPDDDDNDVREVTLYRTAFMNGRVGYWGMVDAGEYIVIQYLLPPQNYFEELAAMYWYRFDDVKTTYWGDRDDIASTLYDAGIEVTYNDSEIHIFPGNNATDYIGVGGKK